MSDAGFDFTFSIRVSDPAWHRHHAVVRKHIAVERIERGIVEVGLEHALAQIVEHHHARAATEPAKGFLVELGPDLRTGTKDQQADRLAAVAQRHDEQPSAPVLAAFLVAHHRTGAVIDLGFFAGCGQNDANGLRGVSAAQFTHEAVDRLIAAAIAVLINQILPNRHGVTAAVKPNSMVSRYGSQALAVAVGLEGWGGGFSGVFSPESVITSLAGFAAVQSVGGTWVGVGLPRPQRPGPRTAMPAAFRYALAVSRRTPVCCSMRRSDQPSCPSTMTCCCFSSFKTLLMAREPKRLRCAVNVSNASTVGRF